MNKIKSLFVNKLFKNIAVLVIIAVAFDMIILPGLNARDSLMNAISVVLLLIAIIPAGLAMDNLLDYFTEL